MMANFARLIVGILLLPACWGITRSLFDAIAAATGAEGLFSANTISLLGGILAFAFCWAALGKPVRTYVLGHELTHAIWGLLFGARPSDLQVSENGGSVRLSKTNLLITLAPYFFPFYTFVVIVAALITCAFVRPLPCLPLWLFMIGFTWAFHALFTIETLTRRQPDVKTYGRIFSWTFIYLANVLLVLVWFASTTSLTFSQLGHSLATRSTSTYCGAAGVLAKAAAALYDRINDKGTQP